MRKILELIGHVVDGVSLATWLGIPVTLSAGLGAAIWAYLASMGSLTVVLVFFFISVSMLWCWIGVIWLRDRARSTNPSARIKNLDCSWGYRPEGILLTRAVDKSNNIVWQVHVPMRNALNWPIEAQIVENTVYINNRVPNQKLEHDIPCIIMPNAVSNVYFPGFLVSELGTDGLFSGKVTIRIKYGHPDVGYTRLLTRNYRFDLYVNNSLVAYSTIYFSEAKDKDEFLLENS